MSAKPERRPANSAPDPILSFREKYADAVTQARVSVEHTATEGWSRLFHGHRAANLEQRRSLAKELKGLALMLEDNGLSEEGEKSIADVKKAATAVRESDAAFDLQTISPVRQPVIECDRLRNEAMNEARRIEAEAPMLHVGLEELMRAEIAQSLKPRWESETGRVVIEEPTGAVE